MSDRNYYPPLKLKGKENINPIIRTANSNLGRESGVHMKLYEQPIEGYRNKFVITEDESYFVPYLKKTDAPRMIDILGEIFDLNDPQIYRDVDGKLIGGRIILGY